MNSKSPWSSHTMCWLLVVALACVLFRGLQDRQALRRAAATRSTMEEAQVALATDVALIVGMLRYLSLDQEVTLEGVDLSGGSWVLDLARLDRPLAIVAVNPTCPACREELPEVQLALEAAMLRRRCHWNRRRCA